MKWPWATKQQARPSDRGGENDPAFGFSKDEVRRAALDLPEVFMPSCDNSFWGGTVTACDRRLERVAALRLKYADYPSQIMRRAVMSRCDYYENDARTKREDCETGETRRKHQEYCEREDNKRARVRLLRENLP